MKKLIWICLTITTLLFVTPHSQAEFDESLFNIKIINTSSYVNGRYTRSVLYISEDEIWIGGSATPSGTFLLHTNLEGEVIKDMWIKDTPGDASVITGIAKSGNDLLLHLMDGDTGISFIGILSANENTLRYEKLNGKTGLDASCSNGNGMLLVGYSDKKYDGLQCLWYTFVDSTGKSQFEHFGTPEKVGTYFSPKRCAANSKGFAVYVGARGDGRNLYDGEVFFIDNSGNEVWRKELPEGASVQSLTLTEDSLYLYGAMAIFDENNTIVSTEAMLYFYSLDGDLQWMNPFPTQGLWMGKDTTYGCFTITGDGMQLLLVNQDGSLRELKTFNERVHAKGITDDESGNIIVFSTSDTGQLAILTLQ